MPLNYNAKSDHYSILRRPIWGLILGLCCLVTGSLCLYSSKRFQDEQLADRIAPEIIRLHIIANSDTAKDQQMKLLLRDQILNYISREMNTVIPDTTAKTVHDQTIDWLSGHLEELASVSKRFLAGSDTDQVQVTLGYSYFPSRNYGMITFPCGTYQSLKIIIGQGKGHNWWCVLYPSLCFIDAACPTPTPLETCSTFSAAATDSHKLTLPASSIQKLANVLESEDFASILDSDSGRSQIHVTLKILQIWNAIQGRP